MKEKIYVLDASGIIGGFISEKRPNITTNHVLNEIKDFKSEITVNSALDKGLIQVREPDLESLEIVKQTITESGDVLRLSDADKELVALSVSLKDKYDVEVITDDYSIQNVLKIMKIPYQSVLTNGIDEIYGWIKICRGCRHKYPPDYKYEECEICGSPVYRKKR